MKFRVAFFILTLFCTFAYSTNLQAQEDFPHVEGEVLIRVNEGFNIEDVVLSLAYYKGIQTRIQSRQLLSKHMNIWRMTFNPDILSHSAMLAMARNSQTVQEAQLNYYIEKRVVPNDPSYNQQWQYEQTSDFDLDATAAWDITTGGVTALGDTIVVCVIDDGLEVSHPDMGANVWYNHGEINGNGIDDDGNGYIDDYRGWNADNNNNDIVASSAFQFHGTPVAGIVGAKGNNGVGVSGVNWDVKLMFVVGGGSNADALAAYDYPLSCRKLYNQTNGASGAFVVATNASWGIDNQNCATYAPLVNAMYDTLGAYGVLNAGATTNSNTNVDVSGDFPTSCSSDFMVAVTNMQQNGTKVTNAGYGSTHVDLGAYGEGTYTIERNQSYGSFGGTSGATPHVAGTIGLMYSAPCPRFALMARTQPEQTALLVKQLLLNSTVANTTLNGITVSGGVLNMKNALDSLMDIGCSLSGCHEPYSLQQSAITGSDASLYWDPVDSTSMYYFRYREVGASTWITGNGVDTFTTLNGLTACTNYEFEVAANCDSTNYSSTYYFKTGDCCDAPSAINENNVGLTTASFSWPNVSSANTYTVEYKLKSDTVWSSMVVSADSVLLTGLDSCSTYEIRIISTCNVNVNNQYTNVIEFETSGCGSCTKTGYCPSAGANSNDDWLETVNLETINNTSGNNSGYASFVSTGPTTVLAQGGSYPISVDIGFNTGPWANNWVLKVWIDYNQDETFDDATELAFTKTITSATTNHTGTINVPSNALLSTTRMRISLRWGTGGLMPCDDPSFGEIEDYCVTIEAPTAIEEPLFEEATEVKVYPNPFDNHLMVDLNSPDDQEVIVSLRTIAGHEIVSVDRSLYMGSNTMRLPSSSLPAGMYIVTVQLDNGDVLTKKVIKQ